MLTVLVHFSIERTERLRFEHSHINNMAIHSYLSFCLDGEHYASPVNKVLNILEMCPITPVPLAPEYMVGVINLRGSVLPLIDTRIKFGLGATQVTINTCILVLDITSEGESVFVGALVDSVQEVLELSDDNILPPPTLGSKYKADFITGLARNNEKFVMIMDMDKVFAVSCVMNSLTAETV